MNSSLSQIEALLRAVRETAAEHRESMLQAADPEVRRAVEALLAESGLTSAAGNLLQPELEPITRTILSSGTMLGPYRLEGLLGTGGMGEVFRAMDTRLNRAVAIKVSFQRFDDRFQREAQAISALNHPHVCILYDVGPDYLVMELVEGETLGARLKRGPLSREHVIRYGAEIADALAAAHAKGIVHRDLKPGNVMLTKSGVKLLDFGLARRYSDETLTVTQAVAGTPGYMAPEQLEGARCDARTDIFALGLVLVEMANGKRGGTVPGWMSCVTAPCTAANPEERWQNAADVRIALLGAPTEFTAMPAPRASRQTTVIVAGAITGAALIVLGVVGWAWAPQKRVPDLRAVRFVLSIDETAKASQRLSEGATIPVPSPDGSALAFIGTDASGHVSLFVLRLDSTEAKLLLSTSDASVPFWSPDGQWIGFYAGGKLQKVRPTGGSPQMIASVARFLDPAWGTGGDILFRSDNRTALSTISESAAMRGIKPRAVTQLNESLTENSHRFPTFLPGGRRFLYVSRCTKRENNALYMASLDSATVKRVGPLESNIAFEPTSDGIGTLFYYKDGSLVSRALDTNKGEWKSDPALLIDGIEYDSPSIHASFRLSANGSMAIYQPSGTWKRALRWYGREGERLGVLGEPREALTQSRISPDGSRVAYSIADKETGNRDLWVMQTATGAASRLTVDKGNNWFPVWSPDGSQLVFGSDRKGTNLNLPFAKTSMEPGAGETPLEGKLPPYDWSPNGKWLLFCSQGGDGLWVAPAFGGGPPVQVVVVPPQTNLSMPRFSPDGKWLAYGSDETGRFEVYARPFDGGTVSTSGRVRVSTRGGNYAVWGPDGKEVFFLSPDYTINSVDTRRLGTVTTLPPPVPLFAACPDDGLGQSIEVAYASPFDTRDGRRFLLNCMAAPPGKFIVMLNMRAQ